MAATLDPRWKLDWCRPDGVSRYTNLLIEKSHYNMDQMRWMNWRQHHLQRKDINIWHLKVPQY